MIQIRYGEPQFKIRQENEQHFIFDAIRKTWIVLTEEEWVRQNFIQHLIHEKGYPSSLIAVEKEITLNDLKKRFDILVYDSHHQPWMLVECKAPEVPLDAQVLEQVLRYNISVPVPFLVITNGGYTFGWQKEEGGLRMLNELPVWK